MRSCLLLLALLVMSGCAGELSTSPAAKAAGESAPAGADEPLRHIGTLRHPPMTETSGIVRSSVPGIIWAHNDSGDQARLFAVDLSGAPVVPPFLADRYKVWPGLRVLGAFNVDWEDIALGDGMLYIADMGNNGNARRDLGIYVMPEPDPYAIEHARVLRFIPVRYPDQRRFPAEQWHFDSEALFHADGKVYLLTKHRRPGQILGLEPGSKLYRLDTQDPNRQNVLTLVATRPDLPPPTAADLSPDGQRLAVLTYSGVWLFDRPQQGDNWLADDAERISLNRRLLGLNEAVTWLDHDTLLIANEGRDLFELSVADRPDPR